LCTFGAESGLDPFVVVFLAVRDQQVKR
jgi:hypothetical protein